MAGFVPPSPHSALGAARHREGNSQYVPIKTELEIIKLIEFSRVALLKKHCKSRRDKGLQNFCDTLKRLPRAGTLIQKLHEESRRGF